MFSKIIKFILRPFAKPIRYGVLKVMKKIRRPGDERPSIATADHILDEIILPSAFHIFEEKKFRDLSLFHNLSVSEHDRIFNELEVSGVCLVLFYFEVIKPFTKEDFHFWRGVEENLVGQLKNKLISYGVDNKNIDLMGQLIDMRFEEYQELADALRSTNDFVKSNFKTLSPATKRIAAAVHAIAVGTVDHIRRGKIKEGDPLIKYIIGRLLDLQRIVGKFIDNL